MKPPAEMTRLDFLKLASGVLGGMGIPASASSPDRKPVDPDYIAKGLTAMANAQTWFDAHWGAGILAGYYLCRDHPLDGETKLSIQAQMDAVVETRGEQFAPIKAEPSDEALLPNISKALRPAMDGGLRAHGHAVIFASLALRALRDAPHMAQPSLVDRLCGLSRQIARLKPQVPSSGSQPYANTQEVIEATFTSLARFRPLLGHPDIKRPNFTHMVTHTEALMNLEALGEHELARMGHTGHQIHVSAPVPHVPSADHAEAEPVALEDVMNGRFWSESGNTERWKKPWNQKANPNGDWIASGHLFKVLYSYHRLMGRISDTNQIKLVSAILLERYMNPAVQGG
ncbi:MAG: hypothetical protein JNJ83_24610 [Verrucomicrobiaceae bacterium]|nr:hypothetical protein [Verrucomicrobiaceae bacterium]